MPMLGDTVIGVGIYLPVRRIKQSKNGGSNQSNGGYDDSFRL